MSRRLYDAICAQRYADAQNQFDLCRAGDRRATQVARYGSGYRIGEWLEPGELLLVQGPLTLNWRRRKIGILPKIENGEIAPRPALSGSRAVVA